MADSRLSMPPLDVPAGSPAAADGRGADAVGAASHAAPPGLGADGREDLPERAEKPARKRAPSRRRAARPLPVHHIGIAVHSIEDALGFYRDRLGLEVVDRLALPDRALKIVFVQAANTLIELMEPTHPDTTVARFLERRGPGLHHLCFGTPDIQAHLRELKDRGVELIDESPRPGAHGDVAFLQPETAFGVLVELLQLMPSRAPENT